MCPERVRNENGFSSFVFYSCFRCFILHVSLISLPGSSKDLEEEGAIAWALLLMQLLGLWAPIYGRRSVVICIVCSQGLFADDNQDLTCARALGCMSKASERGLSSTELGIFSTHALARTGSDRPSVSTTVKTWYTYICHGRGRVIATNTAIRSAASGVSWSWVCSTA